MNLILFDIPFTLSTCSYKRSILTLPYFQMNEGLARRRCKCLTLLPEIFELIVPV